LWPIRPSPVNVALSVALAGVNVPALSPAAASAAPVPWKTLLMNAGPPPLVNWSVLPAAGMPFVVPSWLELNAYWQRSVNGSPSVWRESWLGVA
jgi:hypothetical protein